MNRSVGFRHEFRHAWYHPDEGLSIEGRVPVFWLLPVVLGGGMLFASPPEPSASAERELRTHAASLLTTSDRRVRTLNSRVQGLLAEGTRRSETFAKLIVDLNRTDVIVYVEINRKLPSAIAGRLLFATASQDGPRYLRVQISGEATTNMQVAAIGHELRHALEVAGAAEVRDEEGLARFYRRVGTSGPMSGSFDTVDAQMTGRRVLLELQGLL